MATIKLSVIHTRIFHTRGFLLSVTNPKVAIETDNPRPIQSELF